MRYSFAKFGPFVFKTKIEQEKCRQVLQLCKKENNANHQLAGHLKHQYNIDKYKYIDIISNQIKIYVQEANKWYDKSIANQVNIASAWVNFMKAGDFNPPHVHTNCDLSSVLFLQIPNELKKEKNNYKGKHYGPGTLEFMYGEDRDLNNINMNIVPEVGDLVIFPAKVKHVVSPFKCKGVRISVAANFNLS